jgi:hypothetical protein
LPSLTAIIGVTLTADAAAQIALALTVSVSMFDVVARVAGWAIVASGLTVCVLYVHRTRVRLAHSRMPAPSSESRPQPTNPGEMPT